MRFVLIDRVTECEPGRRLVATKNLSIAEEYLADHFPGFPVMPGVLMIEAATQAAAWLVRESEGYAHSQITLMAARGVKFGQFVAPGQALRLEVELIDLPPGTAELKIKGTVADAVAVQGRLTLTRANLGGTIGADARDRRILDGWRALRACLFATGADGADFAGSGPA